MLAFPALWMSVFTSASELFVGYVLKYRNISLLKIGFIIISNDYYAANFALFSFGGFEPTSSRFLIQNDPGDLRHQNDRSARWRDLHPVT